MWNEELIMAFMVFIIGAAVGSFLYAFVHRMAKKENILCGRSRCDNCEHKLSSVDLLPIFGWILRCGRCNYCDAKISTAGLFIEVTTAILFVLSYLFWPNELDGWLEVAQFGLWLIVLSHLIVLAIYDLKYLKLPNKVIYPAIISTAVYWAVSALNTNQIIDINHWIDLVLAMIPIAGIYGMLYLSNHENVGFGDVKLGLAIGFLLPWQGGLATLFLANILLLIAYLFLPKKFFKTRHIPLGSTLIVAAIIVFLCYETWHGFL